MGKGTGIKDMPKIEGIAMAGKMHGGGVKLAHGTKKESDMQEEKNLLNENAIGDTATSMATPKVHSGSFSNGNFMATPRYKSNGTSKTAKTMVKGPDGKPVPDYAFDKEGKNDLSKAPGKFDKVVLGGNKGDESRSKPGKTDYKK